MHQITKDPDATLDYGFDWSSWLQDGETITASSWTADTGLTLGTDTYDDTSTTVWISDGTPRHYPYTVTNRITTSAERIDERSILINVVQR